MAERIDYSLFVERLDDGLGRIELAVESGEKGLSVRDVERALAGLDGLADARLNLTRRRVTLAWRGDDFDPATAIEALRRIGVKSHPLQVDRGEEAEARHAEWLLKCLGVAAFAMMNIMLLSVSVWAGNVSDIAPEQRDFFHWLSALIALPAAAYAGQPFFRSAIGALKRRELNMDVPISLGVLLALGVSVYETAHHAEHAYFDSAVMLLFFLLAGRYLDQAMRRRTRAAAGNLAALKGETARRLDEDGALVTVPVAALAAGDRVLVGPGERIPADGDVLAGASAVDDSVITGETQRRPVGVGDPVYAGGLNFDGALTLRVTAGAAQSLLDEIERLVDRAAAAKSRVLRLADRVARLYAPVVHLTALLTAIGWMLAGAGAHFAVITAIAVLIITCPCALALAVPAVQVVASGALFRAGVLLNAGDALERLAVCDTIVFDKTGTLTSPEPGVANRAEFDSATIETAARLALSSRHPLAQALAREARDRRPFDGAVETVGRGVRALVAGREIRLGAPDFCDVAPPPGAAASVIAFRIGDASGLLSMRQKLRPGAAETVAALAAQGYRLAILSGDAPEAVAPVARALGVAEWRGAVRPADKIAFVEALKRDGRRVLMVGDGLNDAPALAAADASLSPIAAVDLARAQADAVFLGEQLTPVGETLRVARLAMRLMRQNLGLAVIYNLIAVPLAVAGLVTPLIAAAAMSGSSILVTLNALRARPSDRRDAAAAAPAALAAARVAPESAS
ncbi:MAG: cadmium-translocating P-type ATPase [Methylobacteriaceae bacterium]|nr:cadmium-translocating P-type ATPase [Methylobacteriaceae bacterium]